jgi:restriction endonuclease Mrr
MTKGTSEWKKAVAELNKEIADTITQVPELAGAFSMKDGVLRADQTKITEITRIVETQAQEAEINAVIAETEETIAENNLAASNLYDSLFGDKYSKKWMDDSQKREILDKLLSAY